MPVSVDSGDSFCVNTLRTTLAIASVAALLALAGIVAFATPAALGQAASPAGGAAQAVYCPKGQKAQLKAAVDRYKKQMLAARKAFFKTHPNGKQRAAFVKAQNAQLNALVKKFAKCD